MIVSRVKSFLEIVGTEKKRAQKGKKRKISWTRTEHSSTPHFHPSTVSTVVAIISAPLLPESSSIPGMHRLAQSPFPLRWRGCGSGGGGVSRLWRSNCEPHCFSVLCNWLAAAGPVGGRLTKLENNEPAGKQYLDDSTARSLPFPFRPPSTDYIAPPLPVFRYSARKGVEKNTARREGCLVKCIWLRDDIFLVTKHPSQLHFDSSSLRHPGFSTRANRND